MVDIFFCREVRIINSAIDIILIHGFLGAGKTTLLKELLNFYKGQKLGIIENELGEISIDGTLLSKTGIQLQEINNGAIFCSCQHHNFIEALKVFTNQDIDLLLIEASGIADPSPILSDIEFVNLQSSRNCKLLGSICVVDAITVKDLLEVMVVIPKQLHHASIILLNKIDEIKNPDIANTERLIRNYNETAIIIPTKNCIFDFKIFEDLFTSDNLPFSEQSVNTLQNQPNHFLFSLNDPLPFKFLEEMISYLSPMAYRIKGFVRVINQNDQVENKFVSTVKNFISIENWDFPIDRTQLIVIYPAQTPIREFLIDVMKSYK